MKQVTTCAFLALFISLSVPTSLFAHKQNIIEVKKYFNDEEEIRSTVSKFFTALQESKVKEARVYALKDKDCNPFFDMMEAMLKDPNVKKNPAPVIKSIKVDGSKATVQFEGQPPMKLEKEDGAWKIDVRVKASANR